MGKRAVSGADFADVTGTPRGALIQQRLDVLGISDREFHETTGIDRKTLRRAVAGEDRVRPSTYAAIESALADFERSLAGPVSIEPPERTVELFLGDGAGRTAVVKGSVKDLAELQDTVMELYRRVRADAEAPDGE